jgi:hypothetical protein
MRKMIQFLVVTATLAAAAALSDHVSAAVTPDPAAAATEVVYRTPSV